MSPFLSLNSQLFISIFSPLQFGSSSGGVGGARTWSSNLVIRKAQIDSNLETLKWLMSTKHHKTWGLSGLSDGCLLSTSSKSQGITGYHLHDIPRLCHPSDDISVAPLTQHWTNPGSQAFYATTNWNHQTCQHPAKSTLLNHHRPEPSYQPYFKPHASYEGINHPSPSQVAQALDWWPQVDLRF